MGLDNQALLQVKAALCDRIDAIAAALPRQAHIGICEQVDQVRRLAQDHGLGPVAQLARAIESAIARGECAAVIRDYVEAMREAVGCDRVDGAAGEAFLAAIAVRFSG